MGKGEEALLFTSILLDSPEVGKGEEALLLTSIFFDLVTLPFSAIRDDLALGFFLLTGSCGEVGTESGVGEFSLSLYLIFFLRLFCFLLPILDFRSRTAS